MDAIAPSTLTPVHPQSTLPEGSRLIRLAIDLRGISAMKALHADHREMIILWAFARFDIPAFVAASAAVAGVALLSLTLALIIKGAPPGIPVGPHLAELAVLFPGYSVSVGGAFIGAGYASVVGGAAGFILAAFWNAVHSLVLAVVRVRANLATYSID